MKCQTLFFTLLFSGALYTATAQTFNSYPVSSIAGTTNDVNFELIAQADPSFPSGYHPTLFFILYGDGTFGTATGDYFQPTHHYQTGSSYNAKAWFVKKKDISPPPALSTNGNLGTNNGPYTNFISATPNNVNLSTSWLPVGQQGHFVILTIQNTCSTTQNGTVEFSFNSNKTKFFTTEFATYNASTASPVTPSTTLGSTLYNAKWTWSFTGLAPGAQRNYFLYANVQNIPTGSAIPYKADVTMSAYCGKPNTSALSTHSLVTNSGLHAHDPNRKIVNTERICSNADEATLEYCITFQNDGQAPIQHVIVTDDLDVNQLDPGTLTPGYTSHIYQFSPGSVAIFDFQGIALPGINEPGPYQYAYSETIGEFKFSINTLPNLQQGYIDNDADVDFVGIGSLKTNIARVAVLENTDNNPCSIDDRGSANQTGNGPRAAIVAHPNPFTENLHLRLPNMAYGQNATLEVMTAQGQVMYAQGVATSTELNIETAHWPSGLYVVRIRTAHETVVQRAIKQ